MSQAIVKTLLKRRARAVARSQNWQEVLDATYKYALPNRNPWAMESEGSNLNWDIYDNTLVLGLRKFVNRMINALVPPDTNWISLVAGTEVPSDLVEQTNKELQQITDIFFFYLRQSNFDLVIHEAFTDMGISTGVLQANEGKGDDLFIFSAIPSNSVSFDSGPRGDLTAFYRDWKGVPLEACTADNMWGKDFVCPAPILNKPEPICVDLYEISYYDYEADLYKYYVIECSTQEICYEKEDESWEWIGFRWAKLPGEDRGRGPAIDAMPTAATINKAMEDEMKSAALRANPPYMAFTNSIINPFNFRIAPNEIIPVNAMGTETWPLAPLPNGGDISFTAVIVNDLRQQINEIMMAAPMQLPQEGPVRSATEVAIVQQELRENAGASFSRVQRELFDPLVRRLLYILKKRGKIPPIVIDGKQVAITYATPLSMSKNQTDVQNFMNFYQMISAVFTPGAAMNLIDGPRLPMWLGQKLGSDLSLIKDEEQIKALIKKTEELAKNAIQQQQPGQQPGQNAQATGAV